MKSSTVIPEIKSKCRVCLCQKVENVDIYSTDFKCGKICAAIMECTSVQIEPGDQLPTVICKECLYKLHQAYEFRQLCRLSDQTLRQYVNFVVNQSTAEILVKTEPTNFIITNADPTTVAQIICDTTPIIYESDSNIVIDNSTSNVPIQVNQDLQTILTQTIENSQEIMNMPLVVELSERPVENSLDQTDPLILNNETNVEKQPNVKKTTSDKFECRHCSKIYNTKRQLVRHETVTHGERKFTCSICEHKFTEKSVLKSHMMAKHTGERPFKCDFCDKCYVTASHLRIHMRVHTGELPYSCEICLKGFASIGVYKEHVSRHSGLRPFECSNCPMKFSRLAHLTLHRARIHTDRPNKLQKSQGPYQECKICGKKFQRKEQLRRHNRTHTGEKPFKCSVCAKCFLRKWDLDRHLIMHKRRQLVIVPSAVADATIKEIYTLNRKN